MPIETESLRHKEAESEIIRKDIEVFLAQGGVIQKLKMGDASQVVTPAKRVHITVSKKRGKV